MIVDCALYRDGRRQNDGPLALDRAAEICFEDDGFVWLGLFEPDEAELAEVQERFGLHDLAVEDAQSFHLRPKIERYEDGSVLFAVFRTARYVEEREEVDFGEVSVFISRRFVITVRQGDRERSARRAAAARGTARRCSRRARPRSCGRSSTRSSTTTRRLSRDSRGRRGGRGDRVQRRRRADRAHLPPAPRGDRLLSRRAPFARATRRARARHAISPVSGSCRSSSVTSTITSSSSTRRSSPCATCSPRSCRPTWR